MTDIIGKECIHVEVNGSESDALELQRTLPELCKNILAPAIERALEHAAPPAWRLCIERLEIDIGIVPLDQLERELAESVAQKLEKTLREQMPQGGAWQGLVSGNIEVKTEQRSILDGLIHFLTTGSLPWSLRLPKGSSLEQVLLNSWQEQVNRDQIPDATQDLRRALASPVPRARLMRQFSPDFLEIVLAILSPVAGSSLDEVRRVLDGCALPASQRAGLERQLWEELLAQVATGRAPSARYLAESAWRAAPPEARSALQGVLEREWPGSTGAAPAPAGLTGAVQEIPAPSLKTPVEPGGHPQSGGIYVENAGMILLHPFLPQLFHTLGMAEGGRLVQPERALCLLHFLATGQTTAPEYQLVLPKILCGLPLNMPVEADVALTATELEEASALLAAVLRHWEALRNTSPDGLRGAFLLRPGKISLRHGDWLLQVETQTCDILLDPLPWAISAVKLPWMEKLLWVEWR